MEINLFEDLAKYRILVGFLGEREQYGWWQSSFFASGSQAFLAPIFSRTQIVAQSTGVTQAAQTVHDERIGVGNVYHLFRLPEYFEQGIHQALHQPRIEELLATLTCSKEIALDTLHKLGTDKSLAEIGPVRINSIQKLRDPDTWRLALGYYAQGFIRQTEIYPYFSDLS